MVQPEATTGCVHSMGRRSSSLRVDEAKAVGLSKYVSCASPLHATPRTWRKFGWRLSAAAPWPTRELKKVARANPTGRRAHSMRRCLPASRLLLTDGPPAGLAPCAPWRAQARKPHPHTPLDPKSPSSMGARQKGSSAAARSASWRCGRWRSTVGARTSCYGLCVGRLGR